MAATTVAATAATMPAAAAMVTAARWTSVPEISARGLPARTQSEHQAADQQQKGDHTRERASMFGRVGRAADNTQYGSRKEQHISKSDARFSGRSHAQDFTAPPSVPA